LFFAYLESLNLLKCYPEVLLLDCIYKTNHFHILLLDILSYTGINQTFFTIFIFPSSETKDDYMDALKMLYKVLKTCSISFLNVIVTDRDLILMKFIQNVFLFTHNLLCDWHINKNILSYVQESKLFKDQIKKEKDFISQWWSIIFVRTVDDFDQ
jgi:MULE transposase domain